MKVLMILLIGIFFQISLFAQYSVKVGNEDSGTICFEPSNNQYEYGWSATIYTQNDIQSHGQITDIYYKSELFGGFGPGANTFMTKQRIFMKLVTDNEMTSNNFPDTNQMTLVFAGTVEFLNYQLANIHLNTPFDLDENHNLMILYINKNGVAQTDNNYFLMYPAEHNHTINNTVYNNGNSSFPSGAGTYSADMPVVYLRYSPGLDAGISSINQNKTYILPQQADLTCKIHNYMADTITSASIEYKINGTTQPSINWTGNNYCGQQTSSIILQNNFTFAPGQYIVKANTTNPNSGTDELNTNDTLLINIDASDNRILSYQNYSSNQIPFAPYYSFGWSASIYYKDSINLSGQIHSIAYYVNGPTNVNISHQKIFMRTTPDVTNQSTNYPDTNQFIKVFEGSIDYSSQGWHIIKLDTTFFYDNSENLMILYENHAGVTSQNIHFKTGWQHTNAIYNYDNSSFPTNSTTNVSDYVPALRIYFSIPKDAGVTNLTNLNPVIFTGNNDFIIDFKNFGTDTLQDVDIKYSIDQNSPNSYHWNGNINPKNEITNLNIGTSNLNYGTHNVKIWTDNPNFLPDYTNDNDTFKVSIRACSPLAGTYTIGTSPSDFLTINDAVDSLNNCGVNGAVTFNIKSGTYNSQYVLNNVWGTSTSNTVTFQSETGDSTSVVLTTDSTNFLLKLNDASNIIFKNICFKADSVEKTVFIDSTTNNCVFTNNLFISDTNNTTYIYSSENFNNYNIYIEKNRFIKGNTAINLNYDNVAQGTNSIISDNIFETQTNISVYANNSNYIDICKNDFSVIGTGIVVLNCDITSIGNNKINLTNGLKGIDINNCSNVIIYNNFISGSITGGYGGSAIYTTGGWEYTNNYQIIYNTISLQNSDCSFFGNNIDTLKLFNNILVNISEQIIRLFSIDNFTSNNNCFYSENTVFGSYEGSNNIINFDQWKATLNQDTNSIFILPHFNSNTDLHTSSYFIDNNGIPVSEITTDIDGEPRDALTPDIGADEYTSFCSGPLAGSYSVGTTGDFTNFNNAIAALTDCGIQDTVTFEIEAGTYNEQIIIYNNLINYTNGIKPIKFTSQSGNPEDVILEYDADTLNNFVLKLKDISQLTIDGITIQAIDTSFGQVITFEGVVDSCFISNDIINGVNTTNQTTCISTRDLDIDSIMTITFAGNTINNGKAGISRLDNGLVFDGLSLIINNNSFNNQLDKVIYLNPKELIITNNNINSNIATYGIYAYCSDSLNISQNNIILKGNCEYGIYIPYTNAFTSNNFISVTNDNHWCIGLDVGSGKIYNNTIIADGYSPACIYINNSPTYIFNNCLINYNNNQLIYQGNNDYSILTSNYNNLYSPGIDYNSYINTIGGNAHSVSFMPDFVSDTDLHTNSALLYQTGITLPEITNDIDGETRNNPPCIGADEFTNPVFNAGNDTLFCYNTDTYSPYNTYTYDIGDGYDSYQWSNGSDSSSVLVDSLHSVIGNNIYTVTVTIGSYTYSDTVNILYDLPTAIAQTDYCLEYGSSITIYAEPNLTYLWQGGDTTQYYTINNYYNTPYLIVTDNYGCVNKVQIHTEVYSHPAHIFINEHVEAPTDTVICGDDVLTLTGNDYFNNANIYEYNFNWNTGDTTNTLIVDSAHYGIGLHTFIVSVVNKESIFNCITEDTITIEIKNCSSVNNIENKNNISLYPNPANNLIIIANETLKYIQNLQIFDVTGQICNSNIFDQENTIDISNLQNGIYFIKITFDDNSLITKKFIVKH